MNLVRSEGNLCLESDSRYLSTTIDRKGILLKLAYANDQ